MNFEVCKSKSGFYFLKEVPANNPSPSETGKKGKKAKKEGATEAKEIELLKEQATAEESKEEAGEEE